METQADEHCLPAVSMDYSHSFVSVNVLQCYCMYCCSMYCNCVALYTTPAVLAFVLIFDMPLMYMYFVYDIVVNKVLSIYLSTGCTV